MNDKLLHSVAGLLLALFFGDFYGSPAVGFLFAVVTGAAKEIWDYFGHGTSEFGDFLATVQGGLIGAFLIWVVA